MTLKRRPQGRASVPISSPGLSAIRCRLRSAPRAREGTRKAASRGACRPSQQRPNRRSQTQGPLTIRFRRPTGDAVTKSQPLFPGPSSPNCGNVSLRSRHCVAPDHLRAAFLCRLASDPTPSEEKSHENVSFDSRFRPCCGFYCARICRHPKD